MDPESKKLLEENLRLSQENNVILLKLKRSMQVRRFVSIIYWTLIVGSAVGAYYFIQPYIDQMVNIYGGAKDDLENFNQLFQNLKN
ncbi:hypothetical protein A3D42_02945 [Candidatus Nomurabacteria bacterium RIFCSPHIGHO2_02_FULL_41_18]|uniref:Uncharacterized protein n=1 Tax=Candidatus Nomurabacteria bacterium RIFCSPHIGHO2_02_FULL_41_18 TaxID=1801754 RepID=A0A1F6W6I3_9BACT|nr:MAG: hypothetical protein A2737_02210 [Candidatus Nomurabacteria bacterium RIFCSPHIGHO2_01_FULL_41_71]OGI77513.1 MAG: hypothetical protein A3D42_02945 [Candidatus Nomurabacteria bacterium RIFCSPHIGHO2_02_FULL_41_18]OGI89530.1 MAG: hypothetical protein A3B01_00025 [Candidatus Nomurabacteria bacterium RIFCSPLOWO2_01_FULL_41_52b]OGJ00363.1 MAG: hypothetical protein A3I90_02955 [Candidatus Nomurabacteria bacterium RIFCSPLOWO2_02_FULL_41_9]